jgi:hypothetical protein
MKKLVLSIALVTGAYMAQSQVIFSVQSPASIAGELNFENNGTGSGWGLADLEDPNDAILDMLVMANDGTPGLNPQDNPISAEGCNEFLPANKSAMAGKIAVVYRNTCQFGTKAYWAQEAGAIGIVIINRVNELDPMAGGDSGMVVMLPVTMVSSLDGKKMTDEMLNGNVTVFIGNKSSYYANDIGASAKDMVLPKSTGIITKTALNASELTQKLGIKVRNYGSADQVGITVTADVSYNNVSVQSETSIPMALNSGDSAFVTFADLALATYPAGTYTLSYEIMMDVSTTDESLGDNLKTTSFVVNDSIFSYVPLDTVTGLPVANSGSKPGTWGNFFKGCSHYKNANASRIAVKGMYLNAVTNAADSLSGIELQVTVEKINEVFTNLDDAPATITTTEVGTGNYTYGSGMQDYLQNETVYTDLDVPVLLEDNARYLFCITSVYEPVFLGTSSVLDYATNQDTTYKQPISVMHDGSSWNLVAFGTNTIFAVSPFMADRDVSLTEKTSSVEAIAFPNPAHNNVTISLTGEGSANLVIVDITGKVVANKAVSFTNGQANVNIESLDTGMYLFNVTLENGKTAQFNVVKK